MTKKTPSAMLAGQVAGGVAAEVIMVLGYFAYASLWLGKGLAAAASIPGNIVQGVFGLVAATVVYTVLSRSRAVVKVCPLPIRRYANCRQTKNVRRQFFMPFRCALRPAPPATGPSGPCPLMCGESCLWP